jgi:GntR family transcriptional regulator
LKLLFDQVVTELFVLDTPVEELMTRMDGAKANLDIEDDASGFVIQQIRAEAAVTEGNDDTDK